MIRWTDEKKISWLAGKIERCKADIAKLHSPVRDRQQNALLKRYEAELDRLCDIGLRVLEDFAVDNACDVEGAPFFTDAMMELRAAIPNCT